MSRKNHRTWMRGVLHLAALAIAPTVLLAAPPIQAQPSLDAITIGSRFAPNPLEVKGKGGGAVSAQSIAGRPDTPTGACTGYTDSKPNQTLVLTSFFNALSLQVQSSEDTAIVIKGPGGVWCNDDFQGKDPGVSGQWLPGTYQVWITSYAKDRYPSYVLRLTETR